MYEDWEFRDSDLVYTPAESRRRPEQGATGKDRFLAEIAQP